MSAFNDDPVERDYSFLKEWDEPDWPSATAGESENYHRRRVAAEMKDPKFRAEYERVRATAGEPTHSWMKRGRRKVDGHMRTVWRAQAKIGTKPGTIALFLSEPVEGQACEVVEDLSNDIRWERPRRVTIDRIDDVAQRVRCSLR